MWPWSTIRQLRERIAWQEDTNRVLRNSVRELRLDLNAMRTARDEALDRLAVAMKNDKRDSKGRFTKQET